jgi:DNA topoisomerase-3
VFDPDVATVYQSLVSEGRSLRVSGVVTKEERKGRPAGLNTVELLKVASSSLNVGPAQAMQVGWVGWVGRGGRVRGAFVGRGEG